MCLLGRRWLYGFLLGAGWLLSGLATASEPSAVPETADTPQTPGSWLHSGRERLESGTYWLAERIDRWFGDRPFAESGGGVSGSVYLSGLKREDEDFDADIRFRLDLSLPNVDDRIVFFIGRDDPRDVINEQSDRFTEEQRPAGQTVPDEAAFFAGLGYLLRENLQLRLGLRGGYKVYGQARLRGDWRPGERQRLELTETLFLAVDDGLGATTGITHLYSFGDHAVLRSRASATVSTEIDGADWNAVVGWIWGQSNRREWALDFLVQGNTTAPVQVREYGVRNIIRTPLYEDWLVAELTVGRVYRRDARTVSREGRWLAGAGIEVFF